MAERPVPEDEPAALTAFQRRVARLFFSLPAAKDFLLAGGAALVAQNLTTRPTRDLDFFTDSAAAVAVACSQFERAAGDEGWATERLRDTATFTRLIIHGPQELLVDIALDSSPTQGASASFVGPTFAPDELAGRKLLALFDRAEARDFADVFDLAKRFGQGALIEHAAGLDAGFDNHVLANQFATLARFDDDEIPVTADRVEPLRSFFSTWRDELLG